MSLILAIVVIIAAIVSGLVWFTIKTIRRVEAAVPPCGQFREIDGQRIHYVDMGNVSSSRPALVMIHGVGGNLLNFMPSQDSNNLERDAGGKPVSTPDQSPGHAFPHPALVEQLSAEFRIILVDRPGSGYSKRSGGASAALSTQAATIAKLIRALKVEKPVLVGHSLGGAVSLALALDHPDCAGALALIGPLTHPHVVAEPFRPLLIKSRRLRAAVAWTIATPVATFRREGLLRFVFAPAIVPPDFATRGGGLLSMRPSSFYAASSDLVTVNDELRGMTPRYASLRIPFGMVFGTGDQVLDYRKQGEAMKERLPALDLTLIESGHMLQISHAEQSADMIRRVAVKLSTAQSLARNSSQ